MNRKELEELGLEKEQIDKVLDNHHKSLEELKTEIRTKDETITTLQEDNKKKETDLAELSKGNKTAEEIKVELERIQQESAEKIKSYEEKIENMSFESQLEKAILKANPKNLKLVKAALDIESLKSSKDRSTDIDNAIKTLTESEDYSFLFGAKPKGTIEVGGDINETPPARKKTLPKTF